MQGKLLSISRDFKTDKINVTIQVDSSCTAEIQALTTDDELVLEKPKQKRSNDANAYFHVLVGKIADKMNISKPRCKNLLLGRYGQRERDADGKPLIYSVESRIDMAEREDIHSIPIGYGHIGMKEFTHYAIIRGSHTYTSEEMAILISGTRDEAEQLGIQVMTPDEAMRLASLWKA